MSVIRDKCESLLWHQPNLSRIMPITAYPACGGSTLPYSERNLGGEYHLLVSRYGKIDRFGPGATCEEVTNSGVTPREIAALTAAATATQWQRLPRG